jgi:excisionase family DNA binding protein
MDDHSLTPRELAEAIGASESSVRRWVDAGEVRLLRTVGGHRRIPLAEAVRFIRRNRATVVRPDLLGLNGSPTVSVGDHDEDQLYHALAAGDRALVRGLAVSWYLSGRALPALFDGPLRAAMNRIGELWEHDDKGILVEHRATELVTESVTHLRELLTPPGESSPVAVGGAPSGELYTVPSVLAAVTLADAGWRDVNYGPNTPPMLLAAAAEQNGAKLVWFSVSTPANAREASIRDVPLERELRSLAARLNPLGATLVVGGRHAGGHIPRDLANVREMQSMSELHAFASGMLSARH